MSTHEPHIARTWLACPMCDGPRSSPLGPHVSTFRGVKYRGRRCAECGFVFADPYHNTGLDYDEVYQHHAGYGVHEDQLRTIAGIVQDRHTPEAGLSAARWLREHPFAPRYMPILDAFESAHRAGRRLRVLEVGCGYGILGGIARCLGLEYTGIDVAETAIQRARRSFGPHFKAVPLETFAAGHPGEFDLAFALDLIEHIPDPRRFIDRCLGLARERCIFSTPDGDAMLPGCSWFSDFPPVHLSVFCRTAVRRVYGSRYDTRMWTSPLNPRRADRLDLSTLFPFHRSHYSWIHQRKRSPADMDPQSPAFEYRPSRTAPDPPSLERLLGAVHPRLKAFLYRMGFRGRSDCMIIEIRHRR